MQKVQIMQMALKQLKPSPHPVRMSWSEEAMDELTQSIKEQGVIVPIKVRPISAERFDAVTQKLISPKWEIVYGHRRVEASRRAGLRYINVIIEDLDDTEALIQALLENLQREDLDAMDKARATKAVKDAKPDLTIRELAKLLGMSIAQVSRLLALLEEPEEVQQLLTKSPVGVTIGNNLRESLTESHIREVRAEHLPQDQHIQILQKAAEEGLTAQQARVEARILKTYGTEEQQDARVERHAQQNAKDDEQQWWNANAGEVAKDIARTIKRTRAEYQALWLGVERGAIGPEHMPYLEKRLRNLGEYFIGLADELDERRKGAVGG